MTTTDQHANVEDATRAELLAQVVALQGKLESLPAIEQAKGALMITYGLDEAEAFALLRCHSQNTNIKLRDLAAGITDRIGDPGMDGLTADRKISAIFTGLAADASTPTGPAANTIESSGGGDERISA